MTLRRCVALPLFAAVLGASLAAPANAQLQLTPESVQRMPGATQKQKPAAKRKSAPKPKPIAKSKAKSPSVAQPKARPAPPAEPTARREPPPVAAQASVRPSVDANAAFGAFQRGYYRTAFRLATERVEQHNDVKAMALLGELYAHGLGVSRDEALASKWYRLAADRGDREA